MAKSYILIATLAGALAVSACSKKPPQDNLVEEQNIVVEEVEPAPPAPTPEPKPAPIVADAAPPPSKPVAADIQMLDDADATGMTARLPSDADDAGSNSTQR